MIKVIAMLSMLSITSLLYEPLHFESMLCQPVISYVIYSLMNKK